MRASTSRTTPFAARPILGIAGSLRRGSYNRRLLDAAARLALPQVVIEVYADLGAVPLFDEDLEQATEDGPPPIGRLRDAVAAARGLLIATPEYNWSIPGVLKNAVDWLSRPASGGVLRGKPVAVIGASTGPWGTRQAQGVLRHTLAAAEAIVMPAPTLFVRHADRLFDADGALTDDATRRALGGLLERFDAWSAAFTPPAAALATPARTTETTP